LPKCKTINLITQNRTEKHSWFRRNFFIDENKFCIKHIQTDRVFLILIFKNNVKRWLMPYFTVSKFIMPRSGQVFGIFLKSACLLESGVFGVKAYFFGVWFWFYDLVNKGCLFIITRTNKTICFINFLVFESDVWRSKWNWIFWSIEHAHRVTCTLFYSFSNIICYCVV